MERLFKINKFWLNRDLVDNIVISPGIDIKKCRIKNYLKKNGVDTAVQYPVPIHLQTASKFLGYKIGAFPETEKQSNEDLNDAKNKLKKKKSLKESFFILAEDLTILREINYGSWQRKL